MARRFFFWWHVEDLRGFAEAVAKAPDGHVVTFDGEMLRVGPAPSEGRTMSHDGGEFNFTHTCPPDCP